MSRYNLFLFVSTHYYIRVCIITRDDAKKRFYCLSSVRVGVLITLNIRILKGCVNLLSPSPFLIFSFPLMILSLFHYMYVCVCLNTIYTFHYLWLCFLTTGGELLYALLNVSCFRRNEKYVCVCMLNCEMKVDVVYHLA